MNPKTSRRRVLANVTLFLISAWGLISLPPPIGAAPATPSQIAVGASLKAHYAWMNAPWTEDDSPYQAVRDTIERVLSSGRKPADVVKQYQTGTTQRPSDPVAKFGYYYAADRAENVPNGISNLEAWKADGDFNSSVEKHLLPHTYNYARLAFLRNAREVGDIHVIGVGRRLLKQDPQDSSVEYALARVLTYSDTPSDFVQAVTLQKDLARRFPNSPKTAWLLGDIYYHTAYRSHSQADAERSVVAYQHALDVAPPTPEMRNAVRVTVLFIRQLEARWKSGWQRPQPLSLLETFPIHHQPPAPNGAGGLLDKIPRSAYTKPILF